MPRIPKPLYVIVIAVVAVGAAALGFVVWADDEPAVTTTTTTIPPVATEPPTTTDGTTPPVDVAPPPEEPGVSKVRAEFNQQVASVLTTEYELTPEQTDCAIDALNSTVDEAEVKRAVKTGEPSPELLQAAFTAGEECGGE